MKKNTLRTIIPLCLLFIAITLNQVSAQQGYLVNVSDKGVIIDGYDTVAYFTAKKAVPGDQKYQAIYNGAIYYFSSDKNKKEFAKNPEKYAPQYGGFCAVAMSMGHLQPIDVNLFEVIGGKLYLQRNARAVGMWEKMGPKKVIMKSDKNWPIVYERQGSYLTAAQLNDNIELSLEAAKTIAAAGAKYAKKHRAPGGAIAVVDAGGYLLYLERLDGTFPAAATVANEKARTAAMFRFPSKKLEDAIIGGRSSLVTVGHNMLRGGVPIYFRGRVVGGIGVSGAASADQDVEIAMAGANTKFDQATN